MMMMMMTIAGSQKQTCVCVFLGRMLYRPAAIGDTQSTVSTHWRMEWSKQT